MDFADEDRNGTGGAWLFANQISSEAIIFFGAAFDQLAGRGKTREFRGVARCRCDGCGQSDNACRNERRDDHSTLRLSLRMSADHLASSLSMSAAYSSGVEVSGSPPSEWMRCFTSSLLTSLRNSALSLSTISRGIPAGPSTP